MLNLLTLSVVFWILWSDVPVTKNLLLDSATHVYNNEFYWHQHITISPSINCRQHHCPLLPSFFDNLCHWYLASLCLQRRSQKEKLRSVSFRRPKVTFALSAHADAVHRHCARTSIWVYICWTTWSKEALFLPHHYHLPLGMKIMPFHRCILVDY